MCQNIGLDFFLYLEKEARGMRRSFLTAVLVVAVMAAAGLLMAADAPDTIKMKSALWKKHTQGIVTFSHKKHSADYKGACTECHHVYKDGKNTWKEGDNVQKCAECHNIALTPKTDKKAYQKLRKNKKKVKDAYYWAIHENCVKCHKKFKKKDKVKYKKIPTSCAKCHPKKKKK